MNTDILAAVRAEFVKARTDPALQLVLLVAVLMMIGLPLLTLGRRRSGTISSASPDAKGTWPRCCWASSLRPAMSSPAAPRGLLSCAVAAVLCWLARWS